MEPHFELAQGQSHHCTSPRTLPSECRPSLSQSGKLHRHIDPSFGCLEAETRQWLPRRPIFLTNHREHAGPTITDGTFTLIEKILYFSTKKDNNLRLCIPKSMITETIHQSHDLRSHPGIHHTYLTIQPRYYFPRMSRQVKIHCNECAVCQTSKPSNEHPLGQKHPISTDKPIQTQTIN